MNGIRGLGAGLFFVPMNIMRGKVIIFSQHQAAFRNFKLLKGDRGVRSPFLLPETPSYALMGPFFPFFASGVSRGEDVFCFLVGIPTDWIQTQGMRVILLCLLLSFSLHFSVVFADRSEEFLQDELRQRQQRILQQQQ